MSTSSVFREERKDRSNIKEEHPEYIKGQFMKYYSYIKLVVQVLGLLPTICFLWISSWFKQPKSLRGKICLVTGAGQGLGRELCLQLANEGAIIVCVDIRKDTNQETVSMIKSSGGVAYGYICNVAKYEEVIQLAETVKLEVGRVYMLINNAALIMTHRVLSWPPEEIMAMYNVNVFSYYWMTQAFLPIMQEVNDGHIVNIISLSSVAGIISLSVYGPTKAAAANFTDTVRFEINLTKKNKIIITSVYPSIINTNENIPELYQNSSILGMLNKKKAVQEIIYGLKYDKEFISLPKIGFLGLAILSYLPTNVVVSVIDIFTPRIYIPDKSFKESTFFSKIVEKCN